MNVLNTQIALRVAFSFPETEFFNLRISSTVHVDHYTGSSGLSPSVRLNHRCIYLPIYIMLPKYYYYLNNNINKNIYWVVAMFQALLQMLLMHSSHNNAINLVQNRCLKITWKNCCMKTVTVLFLQIRKKCQILDSKSLVHCHIASKCQSWGSPKPVFLTMSQALPCHVDTLRASPAKPSTALSLLWLTQNPCFKDMRQVRIVLWHSKSKFKQ